MKSYLLGLRLNLGYFFLPIFVLNFHAVGVGKRNQLARLLVDVAFHP